MAGRIELGDPVVLNKDMLDQDLRVGQKGWANSVVDMNEPTGEFVDGEPVTVPVTYIYFMPNDQRRMLVVRSTSLDLDEEAKSAGITLDEKTAPKNF